MDAAFIWKLSKLGQIGSSRQRYDDDFSDRLNYQYTSVLFFLFIGLIGIRQYVGKPIQCWIPQEFTRGWEEYAENYCWVANTYFAALQKRLPLIPDRRASHLVYYQWAPIALATQALLFYLPCLIWRIGMRHSGFSVHRVLQLAAESNELVPEVAHKTVHAMARYMEAYIQRQRVYRKKRSGERRRGSTSAKFHQSPQIEIQLPSNEAQWEKDAGQPNHSLQGSPPAYQPPPAPPAGAAEMGQNTSASMLQRWRKPPPPPPPPPHFPLPPSTSAGEQPHSNNAVRFSTDAGHIESEVSESLIKPSSASPALRAKPSCYRFSMKPSKDNAYPWSICRSLTWYCRNRRINTSLSLFQFSRESGTYLTFLYFFVKFLYVVNAVGQIYLMECFVGSKVTFYGAAVLADLIAGRDWQQSGHFPRVTFCDMEAKKLGKNHVYTIQCVLPINMFLEKIYIFLWFWHIMLTIVTLTSLIGWIKCLFWRRGRLKFVRRYLKAVGFLPRMLDPRDRQRTRQFVEEYLTADAFFLIRLIGTNNGDLLASELTSELWSCFLYRAAGPKSPALPPQVARLCPKHAVCTCQICVGGRVNIASVTAAVSGVPKPEASIFEMKNYPEKSPASQQPGCGCEGNRSGEAKEMPSRNKSSAGGDSNTPEDIV